MAASGVLLPEAALTLWWNMILTKYCLLCDEIINVLGFFYIPDKRNYNLTDLRLL